MQSVDMAVVDKAILLFRENYNRPGIEQKRMEYHVVKNKGGPTGTAFAAWLKTEGEDYV